MKPIRQEDWEDFKVQDSPNDRHVLTWPDPGDLRGIPAEFEAFPPKKEGEGEPKYTYAWPPDRITNSNNVAHFWPRIEPLGFGDPPGDLPAEIARYLAPHFPRPVTPTAGIGHPTPTKPMPWRVAEPRARDFMPYVLDHTVPRGLAGVGQVALRERGRANKKRSYIGRGEHEHSDFALQEKLRDGTEARKKKSNFSSGYHPRTIPTTTDMEVLLGNRAAIASDWRVFEDIKRVHAVTFRGDTRPPTEILGRCDGFDPPITRTDAEYLKTNMAGQFEKYLAARFGLDVPLADIRKVIEAVFASRTEERRKTEAFRTEYEKLRRQAWFRAVLKAHSEAERTQTPIVFPDENQPVELTLEPLGAPKRDHTDKELYDELSLQQEYLTWLKALEAEAGHLGRMVRQQFHKRYISTTKSVDRAASANSGGGPVWVYATIVEAGFEVPSTGDDPAVVWSTREAEIAHYGRLPAARIVGFAHFSKGRPTTPIFLRRSFRDGTIFTGQDPRYPEPEELAEAKTLACDAIYEILSGRRPLPPGR